MVSQLRITLLKSTLPFPLTDVWLDLDSLPHENMSSQNPILEALATSSHCQFGPEDFAYLQDHIFEQKSSDSEWSDEDDE